MYENMTFNFENK